MKTMIRLKRTTKNQGFSLIELMVALLIGLIILLALVQIFMNTTQMNVAQNGLARLQENGRFLMQRIKQDIESIGYQPCAAVAMESPQYIDTGFALKPLFTYVNLNNGLPNVENLLIDPQYLLQGHECNDGGQCSPSVNISPGGNPYNAIPSQGLTAGSRALKTDVITMRILVTDGVLVDNKTIPSTKDTINLEITPSDLPLELEVGNQIFMGDCYRSIIANVTSIDENTIQLSKDGDIGDFYGNDFDIDSSWASKDSNTLVFNFTKSFQTVSYYIGLKTDPSDSNNLISSLYRVVNNNAPAEVAEGVERFDLFYGAKLADGTSAYMTADQIQNASTDLCTTPPIPSGSLSQEIMTNEVGCLWRSVFAIRVHMLLNTIYNSSTSAQESYVYSVDGSQSQVPTSIPSGIDPRKMFRREFVQTISLSSVNL